MGRTNTSGPGPHIELGSRARKAFENAGFGEYSLEKIGSKLGLTAGAVGKLFNGHNAASYETLVKICMLTHVNFEWLATGRGNMIYSLTGSTIDISSVPSEKQEAVRTIVKEVIKTFQ